MQIVVTDEMDNVYHILPKQKTMKNEQLDSSKDSVDSNIYGEKIKNINNKYR